MEPSLNGKDWRALGMCRASIAWDAPVRVGACSASTLYAKGNERKSTASFGKS